MNDVENVASEMEGATKTAAAEARHAANEVKSAFEAYQEKLMEIAKENMAFAMEFGQAITAVRSPTDFLNVTNDFTRGDSSCFNSTPASLWLSPRRVFSLYSGCRKVHSGRPSGMRIRSLHESHILEVADGWFESSEDDLSSHELIDKARAASA